MVRAQWKVIILLILLMVIPSDGLFHSIYRSILVAQPFKGNAGQPLFLSPYIRTGKIKEGQRKSMVSPFPGMYDKSYAGYITVNQTYNSNLFFWFFPARTQPADAPVVLWLQGGPGGSSMFGLFVEHGPYIITSNMTVLSRDFPWTFSLSMLYIDNPVGTGFSFTDHIQGYAIDEDDVAQDLYSALVQFFKLFPEYAKNDFYITGESYAGKYVPAIAYYIHSLNPVRRFKIRLKGIALGDAYTDPETVLDELLDGDLTAGPSFFQNVTGCTNYYNILQCTEPEDQSYFSKFLSLPQVRQAIHVGNRNFSDGAEVEKYLREDTVKSVKPWLAEIMNYYKVLIYNGQLDIIVAAALTERSLMTMDWKGSYAYRRTHKKIWKIFESDDEVAGYVRRVGKFHQVIVRGGGHILPYDQPLRSFDMINRFIYDRGWEPYKL
ncbi:similar to Probable serine carboxypeptidase CPVL precursor (Carboxypeptidase, vitellogenic-like) (Vitellogenic carboxypeptidase-like protein) (VCP-like protein) [Rattus norvegicus]|uniref:Carboxypeptidase n=2 Tax=Rattus norvegicus TaxID=10116 RepID=A0A8L2R2T7_RAT|nr:similar to Probable serine carboxypeptidase CPVL precursor (Carboxypeptidase, vitellogenic-like) (Vitellogenic carboxypeptidase-like protein) (VCP-like protein) [Rattus norvegicus]